MFDKTYYYLFRIQYLGYRFHGWQKQPNLKTLHRTVDRTLRYILGKEISFKTLASGRTDAMVSSNDSAIELFLKNHQLSDPEAFLEEFNRNLPQDVRALSLEEVDESFNIIQHSKEKEYHYLFSYKEKMHPFAAPLMTNLLHELDIPLMMRAAKLFEGIHNFKKYCYQASESGIYTREIIKSEIVSNEEYTASFFPETSYIFKVVGKGFGRNQVRLMMGALFDLGRNRKSITDIEDSLKDGSRVKIDFVAPASGLILHKTTFE